MIDSEILQQVALSAFISLSVAGVYEIWVRRILRRDPSAVLHDENIERAWTDIQAKWRNRPARED